MFTEEIVIDKNKLMIRVSCNLREYSFQPKEVYNRPIQDIIPDDIKGKIILISAPDKKISNINNSKYQNVGEWHFNIEQEKKPSPRRRPPKKTLDKDLN